MDPATLNAAIVAIAVVAIGWVLFGGESSKADARVKEIATRGGTAKKGLFDFMKTEDNSSRRKQIEASLDEIDQRQKDRKKKLKSLKSKLIQADMSMSPQTFMIISVVLGALVGGGLWFLTQKPLQSAGAAFAAGFGLPRWFVGYLIAKRQKKFVLNFADAMDIIVRGIRTGLPLGDCLKIIAHESPEPVRSEFVRLVEGEAVGVPVDVCLERMYERMPVSEVNFFATVLNIQKQTGGNLGESLSNLSNVLRGRKILREKIKALSAEAKASAMIIGALPLVVMGLVTMASPEYMNELYTTPTGHRNLMIGAGMMVMGTLVMKKMINFKY